MTVRHKVYPSQHLFKKLNIGMTEEQIKLQETIIKRKTRRDKYYRFRTSPREQEEIMKNNRNLMEKHGLKIADVMRTFSLVCDDSNLLHELGLINVSDEYLDYKLKAL